MFKFSNDLIEAYKGKYEDGHDCPRYLYDAQIKQEIQQGQIAVEGWEGWFHTWVEKKIVTDTPKERLEAYLEWNGILGYSNRIYSIATGEM